MGIGTLLSRITGLARLVLLAYVLGGARTADSFNLANNTPNIVHDLVLGGVLSATFVPVIVHRLTSRPREVAIESISAVVTVCGVLLAAATALFVLFAPWIIDLYTLGAHVPADERALATSLLRWFAPQLAAYGAITLMSAVLYASRKFGAPMFVPVLNNLVGMAVLGIFALIQRNPTINTVENRPELVVLLGLGMTLGVVVQAVALVPSMRKSGIKLRFHWAPRDEAVREILSLSGWTFGFVIANQITVFVMLALATHFGQGAVTAYSYAFIFFQLPYGIVAVSVMSAVAPELAEAWSREDVEGMRRRFGSAMRQILAFIVPAMVGYLVLAKSIVALFLSHGAFAAGGHSGAEALTAPMIALFALGLPGYCIYLLVIVAFQSMRDTRTAFGLYLVQNGINILAAFLLELRFGARALPLSLSLSYSIAAVAALAVLGKRIGSLDGGSTLRALVRVVLLSVVMAFAIAFIDATVGSGGGTADVLVRVILAVLVGIGVYAAGATLATWVSTWQTSRRRGAAGRRRQQP
jgi:putative peptidoglycan lipid II flippase